MLGKSCVHCSCIGPLMIGLIYNLLVMPSNYNNSSHALHVYFVDWTLDNRNLSCVSRDHLHTRPRTLTKAYCPHPTAYKSAKIGDQQPPYASCIDFFKDTRSFFRHSFDISSSFLSAMLLIIHYVVSYTFLLVIVSVPLSFIRNFMHLLDHVHILLPNHITKWQYCTFEFSSFSFLYTKLNHNLTIFCFISCLNSDPKRSHSCYLVLRPFLYLLNILSFTVRKRAYLPR